MDQLATAYKKHVLPALPYADDALEPHIDARTMRLHHGKHHASYVKNLNSAIEQYPALHERSATWLLLNPFRIPDAAQTSIRNNAGGHVNHSLFWRAMSPHGGGAPAGALAAAINDEFGSFELFKSEFEDAGANYFGSGWVWLTRSQHIGGRLELQTTFGHGNPLAEGRYPLLVNDLWEHAYYLRYENRRSDYLQQWWKIVDWTEAARRFEAPDPSA